jgi:hypothetical protein
MALIISEPEIATPASGESSLPATRHAPPATSSFSDNHGADNF